MERHVLLWAIWLFVAGCGSSNKCNPGEKGCACIQSTCNDGLICSSGSCAEESHANLSVEGNARSCEVLLHETNGTVGAVEFAKGVTGKWLRQGDKVAAAFLADQDHSISSGEVKVAYAGGFEILKSHCYGGDGVELPNASVKR
jgi:hypothetical protein